MEEQEFISDDFNYSPRPNHGFQTDKYAKIFQLNIPDTIPENISAEFNGDRLKMKGPKDLTENEGKNIGLDFSTDSIKSIDISPSVEIDQSYLKRCEKKLLECSYSEDEKASEPEIKNLVQNILVVSKKNILNDTISTPPSVLRKEISILRSEMAEAHEFHDLEMQLLKEEKGLNEINIGNYLELFEKYSALMELYISLKTEYDEYREEQEKVRNELESKTADCLESLCTQIETSDSSFNFSELSSFSFNKKTLSSTLSGTLTELECTVVQDGTILAHDPLSITEELKNPEETLKDVDKWNSIVEYPLGEVKESPEKVIAIPSQSEYYVQCLNLETALIDKVKEVEALEERLFKVESMSFDLQCEFDRICSVYTEENKSLKASLSMKSEQLNELKQELLSETISLNPSLKDTLSDVPGKKLLLVFMETIMESCKKIRGEDTLKTIENLQNQLASQELKLIELDNLRKTCEGLEKKLSEMSMLKMKENEMTAIKEKLLETDEIIKQLKAQLKSTEEEKLKLQNLCGELQKTNQNLVLEIISAKNSGNLLGGSENEKDEFEERNEKSDIKLFQLEDEPKETNKVEELIREIEQLKKENSKFLKIIETVEKTQKHIAEMLLDMENNDMPSERIGKLMTELSKLPDSDEMKESKIVAGFVETIWKMCKGVQTELMKEHESEKIEMETQRVIDQELIQSLRDQIALLTEKSEEYESKISAVGLEKEWLTKECETLKNQVTEAEKVISSLDEEMEKLASQEIALKETKSELETAKKTVDDLKFHLNTIETEKQQVDVRCQELGKRMQDLQTAKEVIAKELEEVKSIREKLEKENGDLKQQIIKTEEEIRILRKHLEKTEEMRIAKESELKGLEIEIKELKKEKDYYMSLSEKLKSFETNNENLRDIFWDLREYLDLPAELASEINSGRIKNKKIFREKISRLVQTNLSNLEKEIRRTEIDSKENELEGLREKCEVLEAKLSEAETKSYAQDSDIANLQSEIKRCKADFYATKEKLHLLEAELRFATDSKAELEIRCVDFEKIVQTLQEKIVKRENLCEELKAEKSVIETARIELKESYDMLKAQKIEVENLVFTRNEEIRILKSCESELRQVKQNLSSADETIHKLKSELRTVEEEKSEIILRCTELEGSNEALILKLNEMNPFENHPMYQEMNNENSILKWRILESEQKIKELNAELDAAREEQKANLLKVNNLVKEIEELRVGNNGFDRALTTMEETRKKITHVLSEAANDSDLPCERITRLMEKTIPNTGETRESKFYSGFASTITQTCKRVQEELIRKFNDEKLEWENQKESDNEKVKKLTETNSQQSIALEQTKNQLDEAGETINNLKTRLMEAETEMTEMGMRCKRLEENATTLQFEIESKNKIAKQLEELKMHKGKVESENRDLKQQILESEETLGVLKNCLELAKEEQAIRISKIKDLEDEIKTEKESLRRLSENLERLESSNKKLLNLLSDILKVLEMPEEDVEKFLSENVENSRAIKSFIKAKVEGWKFENQNLKIGNETLKEKVRELDKLIMETTSSDLKEEVPNLDLSRVSKSKTKTSKEKKMDLCVRRLNKLEELNHNLTELITQILTITEYPDLEKLRLYSWRDFPNLMKKVTTHIEGLEKRLKELQEENSQLDEECETYANIIKDLKTEAKAICKANKEKTEVMEEEINRLAKEKNSLEEERQNLLSKISKLQREAQKLKVSKCEENSTGANESKKINELKRAILLKEQKLLELQDLESKTSSYKVQIEYLRTALEREKKKASEEKEKNQKLQNDLKVLTKNQKTEDRNSDEREILEELKMRGTLTGGVVHEILEKEKTKKLAKDIAILKELCRARYAEIKRLEAVNAALKNSASMKNSNQMDSPIRSRVYNTRSKNVAIDALWKTEIIGKENSPL